MAAAADFDHERYAALRGGGRLGARVHAVAVHDLDDGRRARRRGPARRRGLRRRLRRGRADGRPGALRPSLGRLARGGAARHLPPLPRRRAAHAAAQRRRRPRHCRGGRGCVRPRRLAEVAERRARRRPQARRHPGRRTARAGRPCRGLPRHRREPAGGGDGGLPPDERARATSIEGAGATPPDAETLLAELSRALERRVGQLERDPPAFLDDWRARLETIGRRVRLAPAGPEAGEGEVEGVAVGVTPLGELTLRLDDGSSRSFAAGDVTTL